MTERHVSRRQAMTGVFAAVSLGGIGVAAPQVASANARSGGEDLGVGVALGALGSNMLAVRVASGRELTLPKVDFGDLAVAEGDFVGVDEQSRALVVKPYLQIDEDGGVWKGNENGDVVKVAQRQ